MSDKNQEFWKELMGEDFKVDLDLDAAPSQKPEPGKPAAPPEAPASQPETPKKPETPKPAAPKPASGFTIEYVTSDGAPEPEKPAPPVTPPEVPEEPPRPIKPAPPAPSQTPASQVPTPQVPASPPPASQTPPSPAPQPDRPRPTRSAPEAKGKSRGKKDFEVEFDFDAEYPDVDEKALKRGGSRRSGCLTGILLFLFVISVSAVLAVMGWNWATDVLGLDGDNALIEVTLPRDIFHEETRKEENDDGEETEVTVTVADMDAVAEELYQKGLIRYKWLFKLFSRFAHGDTKVHAGTYNLKMNYDYRALINGMNPRTGRRNTVKVTIPEGYTITQIAALMEENKVCAPEDFLDAVANSEFDYDFLEDTTLGDPKRLEGFLFPDTYEFYENDDPDSVIKRFLNNFQRKWTDEDNDFIKKARDLGLSVREVMIVASMIEKEAGSNDERDEIASVIYNRLADTDGQHGTNAYLQIDATIRYIIADTGETFSTDIDSPYNTYKYPGLPVGPIANPGLASIRAALNPADTKYYYYALGKTGTHRFFTNYDAFSKFVNSDEYGG